MLMGFIGSTPPAPPLSGGMPGEDGGDDTGIRLSAAALAARSRYCRPRSTLGRYAWAISLGFHAIVLAGAFVAFKYYFHPLPAPKSDADVAGPGGIGSVITSDDATDQVHGRFRITLSPQSPSLDADSGGRDVQPFMHEEPQTVATLSHLRPISGIDGLNIAAGPLPAFAPSPARRSSAATQPGTPVAR